MTTYLLSPIWNGTQFFDYEGNPLTGGMIFTYQQGGFGNQQATWTDPSGASVNSNPIYLDSSGRTTTEMWMPQGWIYNMVLQDRFGHVIQSCENVQAAVVDPAGLPTQAGQGGKLLSTDGIQSLWVDPSVARYPTFLVSLSSLDQGSFDGQDNNNFRAQEFISSPDAHWNDSVAVPAIQLDAIGIWKITVTGNIVANSSWPDQATEYGIYLQDALDYFERSYHFRTSTGSDANQMWSNVNYNGQTPTDTVQWTDTFYFNVTYGEYLINLGMYACMNGGYEYGYNYYAMVECVRITDIPRP